MRGHRWIVLAALLVAAAALLLSLDDGPPPAERREIVYPHAFEEQSLQRREARRTLSLPPAPLRDTPAGGVGAEPEADETGARRDPFLVALPLQGDALVVVFEANALRHSRLGERFIACLEAADRKELAAFQEESGIDPLKDLDRVAFLEDAVVLSGQFQRVRWDQLRAEPRTYGDGGRIYKDGATWIASWRDQLIVLSRTEASARRAIDQLEGRAPVPPTGITEDDAYGEVYGVIPGAAARRILGADERGIGGKLAALASRIELHVDAMQDVAAVVRVRGDDRSGLEDLAKTIGGALAVARLQAQARGDREFADLLEHADVRTWDGAFSLQLAVPADRLERWFADCDRPRRGGGDPRAPEPGAP